MANFIKCECCGGEMHLLEDGVTVECEYCYRRTIWKEPKSEVLVMEMNRANMQRRANKFADAIMSYRIITEKNPKDAEAWWGLVLSTYGIEYVKDYGGEYMPTCHRAIREGIFENEDYKKAYRFAAENQRAEYENEAKEIDRLQKEILRLADAGEDYEVFISFKSKDKGRMTRDAQIARRIYDELTKRGIKTFFSDVTLQGKVGADYEPIIYRALMSCKFFVLVGTSDEYIQSEWVKNEWTRFEERMEREKLSGVACAVFDGNAVKELPAFLRVQGVDLRNYPAGGYEIDVANGAEKIMGRKQKSREEEEILCQIEAQKKAQRELEERLKEMKSSGGGTEQRGASATVRSLLTRGEQELEAGNYDKACAYYNRVLDAEPNSAEAWWGLFLADKKSKSPEQLKQNITKFSSKEYAEITDNRNYANAKKYASGNFSEELQAFERDLAENANGNIALKQLTIAQQIQERQRGQETLSEELERLQASYAAQRSKLYKKQDELKKKSSQCEQESRNLTSLVTIYKKKAYRSVIPKGIVVLCYLFFPLAFLWLIFVAPILALVRRKNRKIYDYYSGELAKANGESEKLRREYNEFNERIESYTRDMEKEGWQVETKFRNLFAQLDETIKTCRIDIENYQRFLSCASSYDIPQNDEGQESA